MNLLKKISYVKSKIIVLMSGSLILFMGEKNILKMEVHTHKKKRNKKLQETRKIMYFVCLWKGICPISFMLKIVMRMKRKLNRPIKILTKHCVTYVWQRDSDRTESQSRT